MRFFQINRFIEAAQKLGVKEQGEALANVVGSTLTARQRRLCHGMKREK
jgi:hypothetical protein